LYAFDRLPDHMVDVRQSKAVVVTAGSRHQQRLTEDVLRFHPSLAASSRPSFSVRIPIVPIRPAPPCPAAPFLSTIPFRPTAPGLALPFPHGMG
jgi:hypothetical protein